MSGHIFNIQNDGQLVKMNEEACPTEDVFQELLAKYPDLLAGDQIDSTAPRRWLLVKREMGIPCEEEGGERWALDHLFLDQDAIPTLVEVKRSSDTRIRREVVGQMLDYAANAVVYWPAETIKAEFEASPDAEERLMEFLGEEIDPEEFWNKVKTNLQAGRIRMLFVADMIPPELRRIVEFLNQQMDPAEVLAVEIKQFVGEGVKTLVPRVIGQTAEADRKKTGVGRSGRQWDEPSFFQTLRERRGEAEAEVARTILDWAKSNSLRIWWGRGANDGSFFPMLDWKDRDNFTVAVWTNGRLKVLFQWMKNRPPFDDEQKRQELRRRLNQIHGVAIPAEKIALRPSIPLSALTDKSSMEQFLGVLDWLVQEVKAT
jgi:hypothetical protein